MTCGWHLTITLSMELPRPAVAMPSPSFSKNSKSDVETKISLTKDIATDIVHLQGEELIRLRSKLEKSVNLNQAVSKLIRATDHCMSEMQNAFHQRHMHFSFLERMILDLQSENNASLVLLENIRESTRKFCGSDLVNFDAHGQSLKSSSSDESSLLQDHLADEPKKLEREERKARETEEREREEKERDGRRKAVETARLQAKGNEEALERRRLAKLEAGAGETIPDTWHRAATTTSPVLSVLGAPMHPTRSESPTPPGSINTTSLIQAQVLALEKSKASFSSRLKTISKRIDHLERAYRVSELKLLNGDWER
ncbi:hypothetical protein BT96DRAFT_721793 [Gymnopus androsaceus JB14]|uniref:Uncharacterized protein n=1 Tax=Gymnopus androsaceus JB14 TaxID=1447944 RepID=A0A6A4HPG8_9AGAR|nr:hypothetical protein BT96DRAFT_721793 [Gymnopus androsaceus JB14]